MEEKQMTATEQSETGAPSAELSWEAIEWQPIKTHVKRLQMRIAKAVREGRHGKVKALQWLLTHSYDAKQLAIRRVTQNRGKNTPGTDGVVWKTSQQKLQAVSGIKHRGYQPHPLRRIYIQKKDGGKRPLSIPTMLDRAQQALHLMSLEPVVETMADKHAYGFRPDRSCADAIEQCFIALAKKSSAQWVLEGDIKSCFDKISHAWILENTVMDKRILKKWLTSGYLEEGILHAMEEGTPQGGIISPCLLVNVLTGLEAAVKAVTIQPDKVNVCVYADDFIMTGANQEILENKVKPVVQAFLAERGLTLSEKKTKITHIEKGFDFLGFNIRKYKGKLLIKPSKASIKRFLSEARQLIKESFGGVTSELIRQLNLKIRGWCNYFHHVVAKETFGKIDHNLFKAIQNWIKRRHPKKSAQWRKEKYFRRKGARNWIFFTKILTKDGKVEIRDLIRAKETPIIRHVKIRNEATPYDPAFKKYFEERHAKRLAKARKLGLLGRLDGDGLRMARAV
jgi:RNA-directed DNA polymerase